MLRPYNSHSLPIDFLLQALHQDTPSLAHSSQVRIAKRVRVLQSVAEKPIHTNVSEPDQCYRDCQRAATQCAVSSQHSRQGVVVEEVVDRSTRAVAAQV